jgi:hypothetical protein
MIARIVLLVSLALLLYPCQGQNTSQASAQNEKDSENQAISAASPTNIAAITAQQKSDNHQNFAKRHGWNYYDAIAPPTWSNWGLVFVGIGASIAALLTLGGIKRQTEIMSKQMDVGIQKERPRIAISFGPCIFDANSATRIEHTIEFWCPSPAFIESTSIEAFSVAALMVKPVSFGLSIDKQIYGNHRHKLLATVCAGNHPEIVDSGEVRKKRVSIHVQGFIKYRDIHLAETDVSYVTPFHYKWVPDEYGATPDAGHWEENGNNKAT